MSTHNRDPQVLAGVCGVVRGFHRSHTAWLWLHRRGPRDVEDRRPSAEQVPQVHLLLHHGHNLGSIVTVAVQALQGLTGDMILPSVVCIAIGLAFGFFLSRVSAKYAEETISEKPTGA